MTCGVGRLAVSWDHHFFVGALAYANDVVLLAPCPSALRKMLQTCQRFATSNGLCFKINSVCLIVFTVSIIRVANWLINSLINNY